MESSSSLIASASAFLSDLQQEAQRIAVRELVAAHLPKCKFFEGDLDFVYFEYITCILKMRSIPLPNWPQFQLVSVSAGDAAGGASAKFVHAPSGLEDIDPCRLILQVKFQSATCRYQHLGISRKVSRDTVLNTLRDAYLFTHIVFLSSRYALEV